ncbi:type II toxin-antitoxin system HicA family toxin [Patescibacteria group bacterium]|nr:type II toxin-antitoxin system HicA family toxin [Patescibacteria group bacterium]
MPKLPSVSSTQTIKALKKIGFVVISQKGSHIKLRRILPTRKDTLTIPNHREIRKGTLKNGILKPINLSVEEFIRLLTK